MAITIYEELTFNTSPEVIYNILTDTKQFSEMTGGQETTIEAVEGGAFSCFGGMIHGRNVELVPNQRVVQAWRVKEWNPGDYSIVKFDLKKQGDQTLLVFDHIGFPEDREEDLRGGWPDNYWEPLKKYINKS